MPKTDRAGVQFEVPLADEEIAAAPVIPRRAGTTGGTAPTFTVHL